MSPFWELIFYGISVVYRSRALRPLRVKNKNRFLVNNGNLKFKKKKNLILTSTQIPQVRLNK